MFFLVTRTPIHFSSFSPETKAATVTNITPPSISHQSSSPNSINTQSSAPRPPKQRKPHHKQPKHPHPQDEHTYFYPERQDDKGPTKYFKQVFFHFFT